MHSRIEKAFRSVLPRQVEPEVIWPLLRGSGKRKCAKMDEQEQEKKEDEEKKGDVVEVSSRI